MSNGLLWNVTLDPANASTNLLSKLVDNSNSAWYSKAWIDVSLYFDTGVVRQYWDESMYVRVYHWYDCKIGSIRVYSSKDNETWDYHGESSITSGYNKNRLFVVGMVAFRYIRVDIADARRGTSGNWGLREVVFSDCGPWTTTSTSSTTETSSTSTASSTTSSSSTISSTSSSTSTTSATTTSSTSSTRTSTSTSSSTASTTSSSSTTTSATTSTSTSSSSTSSTTKTTTTTTTTSSSSSSSSTTTTSTTSTASTTSTTSLTTTSTSTTSSSSSSSTRSTTSSSTSTSTTSTTSTSTTTSSSTSSTTSTSTTSTTSTSTRTWSTTSSSTSTTTSSTTTSTSSTLSTTSSTTSSSSTTSTNTTTMTTTTTTSNTTTSTTTVTASRATPIPDSPAAQVTSLLDEGLNNAHLIYEGLEEEGREVIQWRTPRGAVQATSLSRQVAENSTNGTGNVVVQVEGTEIVVSVPAASILSAVTLGENESVGLLVTIFNNTDMQELEQTSSPDADGQQLTIQVFTVVSIDIVLYSSKGVSKVHVKEAAEPIEFSLGLGLASNLECAYWDPIVHVWSARGLVTAPDNSPDKPFMCTTTHLSLFAAIWKGYTSTIACSQLFTLLTFEALRQLVQGIWPLEIGSVISWIVLAMLMGVFGAAMYFDHRQALSSSWGVEFFLVGSEEGESQRELSDEQVDEGEEDEFTGKKSWRETMSAAMRAGLGTCTTCLGSSAFRDAVDDIMSSWFEHFSDVRTFLEEICGAVDFEGCSLGGSFNLVGFRLTSHLLIAAMRRLAGAHLGISSELVAFIMEDEELVTYLSEGENTKNKPALKSSMSVVGARTRAQNALSEADSGMPEMDRVKHSPHVMRRPSTGSASVLAKGIQWHKSPSKWEAWALLHCEVSRSLVQQGVRYSRGSFPCLRMVWELFLVQNPFKAIFIFNPFMSSKMRALFFALDIMGTFALSILFFEASGSVKGKSKAGLGACSEQDDEDESLAFKFGRLLAVATGSTLLAGLPVALLVSMHTRHFRKLDFPGSSAWNRQLRAWQVQDRIIWFSGSVYALLCLGFLLVFLANLGVEDHRDFAMSVILMLAQVCIILPLLVSISTPTMAWAALSIAVLLGGKGREDYVRQVNHRLHEESNMMLPLMMI